MRLVRIRSHNIPAQSAVPIENMFAFASNADPQLCSCISLCLPLCACHALAINVLHMSPSTSGDAAPPVSVRPSSPDDKSAPVPIPMPLHVPEEGGDQDQQAYLHGCVPTQSLLLPASVSASAPCRAAAMLAPDNGLVKSPPAADGDEAKAGPLSTPTTPVPSIEKYVAPDQNDKKPRGPVPVPIGVSVPKRPNGHSVLTQQLAEARGIALPTTGHPLDAPHPSPRLQHLSCDTLIGSRLKQDLSSQGSYTRPQEPTDEPEAYHDTDGDVLTPRASPRALAMAATSAVSTMSLPPPRATDAALSRTFNSSDFGDVEHMIKSHMDTHRTVGRGMSTESSTDKERRLKEPAFATRTCSDTYMSPTAATTMTSNQPGSGSAVEPIPQPPTRPRKPDHRVSTGPEKVWSIGSEDLSNAQDGQVEKSIAEVLAGVEHNARSRKASHSLRFFKEGLPEEKLKRRDSRLSPQEKLPVTIDDVSQSGGPVRGLQPSPAPQGEVPGRLGRTRTFPLPSTDVRPDDAEPADYFKTRHGEYNGHAGFPSPAADSDNQSSESPDSASKKETKHAGKREDTSDTPVEDAAGEDGELSGEEKISSALFVPHKGLRLQDVSEHADEAESDVDAHAKPHQKGDAGSSWLVKADEPEADEPGTPNGPAAAEADENARLEREAEQSSSDSKPSPRAIATPSTSRELDAAAPKPSKPADLASPGHDEHVHDHQLSLEQPLDAIELVPYRHQVGGHTTVWRFSKKAVCKQLNNRENEFYEQIERHHRDLLPFLPR